MLTTHTDIDPRVRRTQEYLREALIELVLEEGYQDITIKDLADRACVNRSTFYLHYQDKDDLLKTGFAQYWDQVLPGTSLFIYHKPILPPDRLLALLEADLRHFDGLRDFYRVTLIEQEIPFFREYLENHLVRIMTVRFTPLLSLASIPAVPLQMVHCWLAFAYLGIILEWLAADQPAPPDLLASQLGRLFLDQLQGIFCPDGLPAERITRQEQIA
jgi:AcrR family transcriptional regulator